MHLKIYEYIIDSDKSVNLLSRIGIFTKLSPWIANNPRLIRMDKEDSDQAISRGGSWMIYEGVGSI